MTGRKLLFWLHLGLGWIAGLVILILCATGWCLALEKEWLRWADRSSAVPTSTAVQPLPITELIARAAATRDGAKPSGITLYADPERPWSVSFGRSETVWIYPRTGELAGQASRRTREWMRFLTDWHRWLGREGEMREWGKAITGAANVMFLLLALSGLILWAPRRWSREALQAALRFRWNVKGRARDWNWHTVAGFWMSPILLLLTLTGVVISYRWAGDAVYRIAGSTPPAPGSGPGGGGGAVVVPSPSEGAKPLSWDVLVAKVQMESPGWEQINLRLPASGRRGDRDVAPRSSDSARRGGRGENQGEKTGAGPQAVSVSVRDFGSLPQSGTRQLYLDPYTGTVLKREGYADYDAGRRLRLWLRFLHTGEALGTPGRYLAAIACLVGILLVWTGFALSWRRFFTRSSELAVEVEGTKS